MSAANVATCYNLTQVKEGLALPTSNVASPWSCTIGNNCYYYYSAVAYYSSKCQCGGDGKGYCPYAGTPELTDRIKSEPIILALSRCHTEDRYNYRAY